MATGGGAPIPDIPINEEDTPGARRERGDSGAGDVTAVEMEPAVPSQKEVGSLAPYMYPKNPTPSPLMSTVQRVIAPELIGHHPNMPMSYGASMMQPMYPMTRHMVNIAGDHNLVILDSDVQSTGSVPRATSIFPERVRSQHPASLEESKQKLNQQLKRKYSRLVKQVQPIPFIKDKYSIDKVFTEVGMNYKPAGDDDTWQKLDSHHDIPTGAIGRSRVQIIEGDPGYGKSMLGLRLVHDWCTCDPRSPLNNVDILICLNLRQLGGLKSIYEAIVKCLLPLDSSIKESDVKQLLQNEDIRTLLLFDAYDEYPDKDKDGNFVSQILEGNLLQHVNIILTTRSSCIPEGCDGLTAGRIKLTGFDGRAREEYVRKVVTGGDEEATQKIVTQFNTNPILADICQAPLFSVIFAHSAHEAKINIDFRSVTEFFGYMVNCFHYHARNKAQTKAAPEEQAQFQKFKDNHNKLDELAYKVLSAGSQQFPWDKDIFVKELGEEFYKRHTDIGILVEEEVINRSFPNQPDPYKTEVRFFHKLACEWYAAHHLVERFTSYPLSLPENLVGLLDPSDLHHVYRFACGLDSLAAPGVLNLLKGKEDCDRLAVLCALEQRGKVDDVLHTVRDLVSRDVRINGHDSRLLQRTTIELVQRACQNGIPVSRLQLWGCSAKFDVTNSCIVLESDLRLANMKTVRGLHVKERSASEHKITKEELLGLLQTCEGLEELRFTSWYLLLPRSIPPEMIPPTLKERSIHVLYDRKHGLVYRLSFEHGRWEILDPRAGQSLRVAIDQSDSHLQQEWCIQELTIAAEAGAAIGFLHLFGSFYTVADNGQSITLKSGCTMPVLQTLQNVGIWNTNINLAMFFRILSYTKECPQMTTLRFIECQLPGVVDPGLIPPLLKLRRVVVQWMPPHYKDTWCNLDLETGRWEAV